MMPGVILSCQVIDRTPIKLLRSELSYIRREALRELAQWFHENMVARRFTPGNESRYRHEQRNQVYKQQIKRKVGSGQGKYVNNTLSGKSKRRALAFPRITATANVATLRVDTPTYFRRPFKGTFRDTQSGRLKRVTRQPDKVAETIRISDQEKDELREKFQELLSKHLDHLPERVPQMRDTHGRFIKAG